jgi:hypothetical protein
VAETTLAGKAGGRLVVRRTRLVEVAVVLAEKITDITGRQPCSLRGG